MGHATPVFTSVSPSLSAVLRSCWAPSPSGRLSRPRSTTGPPPRPGPISRPCVHPVRCAAGGGVGRESRNGSHVHPRTLRRDRHPAMPLHHRHDYAAGLHRGLPVRRHHPAGKFPAGPGRQVRGATRPMSARFRVGGFVLRSVQPLVPRVCLSVSLAEPAPSGSTGTTRRCRGLLHQPPPRRGSRPSSSFHTPAATGIPRWPPTTARVRERLVALDVGDPQPVRRGRVEVAADQIGCSVRCRIRHRGPRPPVTVCGRLPRRASA